MKKYKVATVLGARPQFVKAAIVSQALKESQRFDEFLIHTGQHFSANMSDIFFNQMGIQEPKYHLDINSLSHGAMTGRMLEQIEEVLINEKPDFVLVYGDTNSTLAGALAASKLHIPIAHVEAGLRSFNMRMPEEVNRILTDKISNILFCPTESATKNLASEGYNSETPKIILNGDVMQDAAIYFSSIDAQLEKSTNEISSSGDYILCTMHRQENTDDPIRLKSIVEALNKINESTKIVLPLHPRTKNALEKNNLKFNFETIDPIGYLDILHLLKNCKMVMTDSGGMQKEAYFFKKYCLTLRDETEWVELVQNNYNTLVGASFDNILDTYQQFINKSVNFDKELYGGGNASKIIAQELIKYIED